MAFRIAARMALRQAVRDAGPKILEPIMKVEVETPDEYQGFVIGDLSSRRGMIQGSESNEDSALTVIVAYVPLSEMFGYSTDLRSGSAGKATYTMEFYKYAPAAHDVEEKVVKARAEKVAEGFRD
jgi:elongation factor G